MGFLGLLLVLLLLWPTAGFVRRTWRREENRVAAAGVAVYAAVALALAVYQFFLR